MKTYYDQKFEDDERTILNALAQQYHRIRRSEITEITRISDWSAKDRLGVLVRRGLVEVRRGGLVGQHGCFVYRITDAGRKALEIAA